MNPVRFNNFTPLTRFQPGEQHRDASDSLLSRLALLFVLVFIFLIPWGDGVWDGLARAFGILSFGMAGLVLLFHGVPRHFNLFHLFVILFWSWVLLSVMWTPDLPEGLEMAKRAFQIMLLPFLFTLIIDSKRKLLMAYQSYVFGNLAGSAIIFSNYLQGIQSPYYNRYGIQNIETDILSMILALAVPLAAYLASQQTNRLLKLVNLLAIPIVFYAIFLTGTRTGSIVALLGIMYWLFTHRKSTVRVKFTIVTVFLMSIVAVISLAPKASVERVFSAGESIKTGTLNYRTVIWSSAFEQWKKSAWTGSGLGGLGHVLNQKHVNFKAAHNTYLHLLTENGIIGLTLYVLVLVSVYYFASKAPFNEKVFLLTVLFSIMLSQITLHTQIQKETWFALTMIVLHSQLFSRRPD